MVWMRSEPERYDPRERAREKQAARDADERALAANPELAEEIRRANEVFAPLAASGRIDLPSARSLS